MNGKTGQRARRRIVLWDLPTRLFHWALVITLAAAWFSNVAGEMYLHMYCGYTAATLVVWRILWGLVGSETARFWQFVRGPRAVIRYLRTGWRDRVGHNPVGAFSVLAFLVLVLLQAGTGLFSNDDIFFDGPWSGVLTKDTSDSVTAYHQLNKNILLVLIGLHVLTIIWYRYKGDDLIGPMVTGEKSVEHDVAQPRRSPLWLAAILLAVAAGAVGVAFRFWVL